MEQSEIHMLCSKEVLSRSVIAGGKSAQAHFDNDNHQQPKIETRSGMIVIVW